MKYLLGILLVVFAMLLYSCGSKPQRLTEMSNQSIQYAKSDSITHDLSLKNTGPSAGNMEEISGVKTSVNKSLKNVVGSSEESSSVQGVKARSHAVSAPSANKSLKNAIKLTTAQHNALISNGTLVYKIDSVFTFNVVSKVEARIIKNVSDSITNILISLTHRTNTGEIKTQIIQVGDIMDMSLVSLDPDAFVINKVSSGDQMVNRTSVTEWLWGVIPKKIGEFDLILKATIRENKAASDKIVFDKTINVVNKPKRTWSYDLKIPNNLVNNSPNIIAITMTENSTSNKNIFKWGGFGEVQLEFNNELDYTITMSDTDNITDSKSLFINKWIVAVGFN